MRQTLDNVVPPRRFERLTYGLEVRCSIQLSYRRIEVGVVIRFLSPGKK